MKHLPRIICDVIPHKDQIYDTAGDYEKQHGEWFFTISKMEADYEFMVLVHEIIEWYLTQKRGIKLKDIDYFDMKGEGKDSADPGSMKSAPYYKEHMFSMKIEKMLCKELGLDWKKYDKSFNKLKWK